MRQGSSYIQIMHSAARFWDMAAALEMKGKAIGFVGDKTPYSQPLPVILPTKNSWEWASVKYVVDAVAMKTYYGDPDTYWKL